MSYAATMENSMEIPQKIKNRTTLWSSNPLFFPYLKEMKTGYRRDTWHSQAYLSIVHNGQDMETT